MRPQELGKCAQSVSGLSFWVLVTTTHVKVWDGWSITTVLGAGRCIRHWRTPRTHWPASFQVPDSVSIKGGEELSKTSSVNLQPQLVLTHTVHTPTDVYIELMCTHTTIIWPHIGGEVRTQTHCEGNTDQIIYCSHLCVYRLQVQNPPTFPTFSFLLQNSSNQLKLPSLCLSPSSFCSASVTWQLIAATVSINSERNLPFVFEKRRNPSTSNNMHGP